MINFKRDGTKIGIVVDTKVSDSPHRLFDFWELDDEAIAIVMQCHLQKALYRVIKETRRLEYERGWKDAKSKKVQKERWFKSVLEP